MYKCAKINIGDFMEDKKEETLTKRKMRLWFKILIATVIFIIGLILYSRFVATTGLIVKEYLIVNDELPASFSGLKIAHISDIHYGQTTNIDELQKIIKQVNQYNPDIIVITGDLLDSDIKYTKKEIKELYNTLKNLNAKLGKYIIKGNHDNLHKDFETIVLNSNLTSLDEQYNVLYFEDYEPILIAGMSTGEYTNKTPQEKVQDAINEIKSKEISYSILIMHEPDYINDIEYDNFDLVLAGHSHNGQVRLPIIGALVLPPHAKEYYDEYYKLQNTDLYISSGIGTSTIKFRLFNRPSFNLYRIVNK